MKRKPTDPIDHPIDPPTDHSRKHPRKQYDEKMDKIPSSVMAQFLGPINFGKLRTVSKSHPMYDAQLSKKQLKKAMLYSIFWTFDNHRSLSNRLTFVFRNPTKPSGIAVDLRNSSSSGTNKKFTVTISGGGDDYYADYMEGKDGIRINNRVSFEYEFPVPSKRHVAETFLRWLVEKNFSKIDLNKSTHFAEYYEGIIHQTEYYDEKSKDSTTSKEHEVVKEMKCCFELLMNRYVEN